MKNSKIRFVSPNLLIFIHEYEIWKSRKIVNIQYSITNEEIGKTNEIEANLDIEYSILDILHLKYW